MRTILRMLRVVRVAFRVVLAGLHARLSAVLAMMVSGRNSWPPRTASFRVYRSFLEREKPAYCERYLRGHLRYDGPTSLYDTILAHLDHFNAEYALVELIKQPDGELWLALDSPPASWTDWERCEPAKNGD